MLNLHSDPLIILMRSSVLVPIITADVRCSILHCIDGLFCSIEGKFTLQRMKGWTIIITELYARELKAGAVRFIFKVCRYEEEQGLDV